METLNEHEKNLLKTEPTIFPAIKAFHERTRCDLKAARDAVVDYRDSANNPDDAKLAHRLGLAFTVIAGMLNTRVADINNKARLFVLNRDLLLLREILKD